MRICDINNLYSPTGGGVRTYHEQKLRYYGTRGDTPYALMAPSKAPGRTKDGLIQRVDLPAVSLGGSGYGLTLGPRVVRRALERFDPDVIEVGSAYVMPALVHWALRGRRLRRKRRALVGFVHANYPETYVEPLCARWGGVGAAKLGLGAANAHMAAVYRHFDATFVASHHLVEKMRDLGVPHVHHTPLGFDSARFRRDRRRASVRARWGVGEGDSLLVFVGRLSKDKGIETLMKAYPALRRLPRQKTVVLGHGPYENALRVVGKREGGLELAGFVHDGDVVADLFAAADAVLSLGRYETFSLASIEAMGSGTPVVAPYDGGAGELVRASGAGACFETANVRDLVDACKRTLETPPARRDLLAAWAHANYGWDTQCARIHAAYEHTLQRVRA